MRMQDDGLYGNGIAKKHWRDLWNGDLHPPEGWPGPMEERRQQRPQLITKEEREKARSSVG